MKKKQNLRVTTAAEVPRLSNTNSLTLGNRLAQMPGFKPGNVVDRRQASHMESTLRPQTFNPTDSPRRDAKDIQFSISPRGVQMTAHQIPRKQALDPTVSDKPRKRYKL